jgi:adenylosuccinate lyase
MILWLIFSPEGFDAMKRTIDVGVEGLRDDIYVNPLAERYASREMLEVFSARRKYTTWRRLWIALAESERELGLAITPRQIAELKRNAGRLNLARAAAHERQTKHDVMAHIRAFGDQCPAARGIIHLGATSAFVTDNADLVQIRDGLALLRVKLLNVLDALARFARRTRDLPCLAFTHFQPAQLTTVGKRACLWIQDFASDLDALDFRASRLRFLGVKGATGTQASFMALFSGDAGKVRRLDERVAARMGFPGVVRVSGQTYSRKVDAQVLDVLSGVAQSAAKFSTDLRLLQHLHEVEEPFGKGQVGSSAMAYKRNPTRAERITSLARFVIATSSAAAYTAATQWFERTLDDSAGRRIFVPETFLAADAVLVLLLALARNLVVNRDVIARHAMDELPFMATENLIMAGVKAGGDRQALHEVIRRHSMEAAAAVRLGKPNPLLASLNADPAFAKVRNQFDRIADPRRYVGRAPQQVDEFLKAEVEPALKRDRASLGLEVDLERLV